MKTVKILFASLLFAAFCNAQTNLSTDKNNTQESQHLSSSSFPISKFVSPSQAEKILGKPSHVSDSLWKSSGNYLRYQFHYTVNFKDTTKRGQGQPSLFFSLEEYEQPSLVQRAFSLIKAENEKTSAPTNLDKMGDEAFLVKDQLGFPFIVMRKNNRLFKLKTYYVPDETSSLNELLSLAKKIVSEN